MRTGRCDELRRGRGDDGASAAASCSALARERGHPARRRRHAPVEPLAGPADHRHAALPPQRRAAPLRRLAQQHLRPPRPRRHPRRRPRDRRLQRAAQLPARAARALGQLAVRRGGRTRASTRPGRRSSRACSRAAASPTPTTAGRASRTTSRSSTGRARSPSTRSSGGACGRTSPTRRSRSGSATPSPTSPRRRASPRSPTRSPPAAPARIDEGEPLPDLPNRLLEENLWRAIRYGLSGELIDFDRGEPVPARARLEQLIEWVAPVAEEIGAAPFLAVPGRERRRAPARALARGRDAARRSTPSRSRRERIG